MSIRVYILKEGNDLTRTKNLGNFLFNDGRFEVIVPNFDLLPMNSPDLELKKVINILINSKNESKDKPVIIVKDTAISLVSSEYLADTLSRIVIDHDFDVFYLTRWMDKCDANEFIEKIDMISLVKSKQPLGMQALLFTPQGRDKALDILRFSNEVDAADILRRNILEGKINAISTSPNLLEYDITIDNKQITKTMLCAPEIPRRETPPPPPPTSSLSDNPVMQSLPFTSANLILFLLVFLVLVLLL